MNPELKKIGNKLFLATQKVELGKLDEIEKAKANLLSKAKEHFNKRDTWGVESNKILSMVGDLERKGIELKKETDLLDKELVNIYTEISNLKKQADSLGLELPREINLLDGIELRAWRNKFVDTREIVNEFKNKLK